MTVAPFWLHAVVRDGECAAVAEAAALLARLLSEADGAPCAVHHAVHASAAAIPQDARGAVILSASLEVAGDAPIADVKTRWQAGIGALTGPVFLCTLFRRIHEDAPEAVTIERIRRLDLMLAELSQAGGGGVIDIDRALAHIGGRTLAVDYRLGSPAGVAAAAHAIVGTLLAAGLDPLVPFELTDRAKAALGTWQPDVSAARAAGIADAARALRTRRDGSKSQTFDAAGDAPVIKSSVADLLGALRGGRIGAGEAGAIVLRGVRRIGLRRAATLAARELAARLPGRGRGG